MMVPLSTTHVIICIGNAIHYFSFFFPHVFHKVESDRVVLLGQIVSMVGPMIWKILLIGALEFECYLEMGG